DGNPGAGLARAAPGPGTRPAGAPAGPGHAGGAYRRHAHGRGEAAAAGAGGRRGAARAAGASGRSRRRAVSSHAAVAGTVPDQRLHPGSWLFVLLQQVRQFVVAPLALLVAGRRESGRWEYGKYAPLLGIVVLGALSVMQYFTYRE